MQPHPMDLKGLKSIYVATGGKHWSSSENWSWPPLTPLEEWHGVTVDSTGRVTELNLQANGLKGKILPEGLGLLTSLKQVNLEGNDFMNAPLPASLGNLTSLYSLWLENCGVELKPDSASNTGSSKRGAGPKPKKAEKPKPSLRCSTRDEVLELFRAAGGKGILAKVLKTKERES